jgi:DNA-binding transcriptional LysR family regulator
VELRQLRYFLTVAKEQNFTRAAEELHIAQPPLSRQIQQLEEELGVTLFERGSRPVRLTDAGRVLFNQAVHVLESVNEIKGMPSGFAMPSAHGSVLVLCRQLSTPNCLTSSAIIAQPARRSSWSCSK